MKKVKCLISGGATREHFDPVRYISNPATGKMGIAIAKASARKGWDTTLVLGPTFLPNPEGVETINVTSADDMFEALDKLFDSCDILIMSAAVSDMKPRVRKGTKVKKGDINFNVDCVPTIDILKTLSMRKKNQRLVGFAAETDNLESYALRKLEEKNLDCVAANIVNSGEGGFGSDKNEIILFMRDGTRRFLTMSSKHVIGDELIDIFEKEYFADSTELYTL